MNTQTPGPLESDCGLIWPPDMTQPAAGVARAAFEFGSGFEPSEQERATARLLAASYNAFDKAGRELGIDAAELAERIDLAALIRAARDWRGNGFPSCGIDDTKIGPTPADPIVDALRFYANRENWKDIETGIGTYPGDAVDYGAKARAALGKLPA